MIAAVAVVAAAAVPAKSKRTASKVFAASAVDGLNNEMAYCNPSRGIGYDNFDCDLFESVETFFRRRQ